MHWNLTNVSKRYGSHPALDELQLATPQDAQIKCLALIGPSGGGKSTLLRHLAGLETPDSGVLTLDRAALPQDEPGLRAYRSQNGFLFQSYNLFPHLTVQENITLPLQLVHHLEPAQARSRAAELLERFQLSSQAPKFPHQLSGGQQQRVALIRATATQPKILFLDEPTAALDPEMTGEVLGLVHELIKAGQRVVLATHALGFARLAADHIAFVAAGKVLEHGSPEHMLEKTSHPSIVKFLQRIQAFG